MTPLQIKYSETNVFHKQFKKLKKKFRTLDSDLETVKKNAIELYHLNQIDNQSIFPLPNYCSPQIQICKVKKFTCQSLKGRGNRSGIRIIYAYHQITCQVIFIQIYFKADQAMEDRQLIKQYLKII